MSMLIIKDERILKFLMKRGFVFLFSTRELKEGKGWVRASPTGKKIADVRIRLLTKIKPERIKLSSFLRGSGFNTLDEWIDSLKKENKDLREGYLYLVSRFLEK